MKITLPSSGVLGTKTVEMRAPTFADIRELNNSNQIEGILKLSFVKRLLDSRVNLNKITKCDMEYLFMIAASSVQFNALSYKVTCSSCSNVIAAKFKLEEKDVVTLNGKEKPCEVTIDGTKYRYHIISAQGEEDALEYALQKEDFDTAYQDALVCLTLFKSLDKVEEVKNLETSVYLSTFLYQNCAFHGVRLTDVIKCSCGNRIKVNLVGTTNLVSIDVATLMRQFASVSDHMSYEGFLTFTIPEFRTYIQTLNVRVNG